MNRTVHTIRLKPIAGARFQPTGFPDLGPATFQVPLPDGSSEEWLHVESPQSMANRLEAVTWDDAAHDQVEPLRGLPYVRIINPDGEFLSSSRLEAHRLGSAYIMDGQIDGFEGRKALVGILGLPDDGFADHRDLARAICRLDPLSLIHGVFFAQKQWSSQPKIARAVTSFIDARDVRVAVSGGVKTDSVLSKQRGAGAGSAEGYGMVPHQRTEFTAAEIVASVVVDHAQIRSYGLGEAGTELLEAIVDFELAHLFRAGGLRLRTACDLVPVDGSEESIPPVADADSRVRTAISAASELFGTVLEVVWSHKGKK